MNRKTLIGFFVLIVIWVLAFRSVADEPKRVISLAPSITEAIYFLEAEDMLVGCTTYCKKPQKALGEKEIVATVVDINTEKIIGLNPSLVLVSSLADKNSLRKIEGVGIEVIVLPQPKSFNELCEQFLMLGDVLGKENMAKEIVKSARGRVSKEVKRIEGLKKPSVFIQVGARPLFTVTKNYLLNDFIKLAGGVNIAEHEITGHYSREQVVDKNPDFIIVVTMGIVGEQEKEIWEGFESLEASKNKRIFIIDSDKVCSPSPLTFVDSLREISKILHPLEADKEL